jgi:hypothetical protein
MSTLRRARHGRALREQIREHEQDLSRLDHELTHLNQQLRHARERALELTRSRPRRERALTRQRTLEPSPQPERSLSRGIDF